MMKGHARLEKSQQQCMQQTAIAVEALDGLAQRLEQSALAVRNINEEARIELDTARARLGAQRTVLSSAARHAKALSTEASESFMTMAKQISADATTHQQRVVDMLAPLEKQAGTLVKQLNNAADGLYNGFGSVLAQSSRAIASIEDKSDQFTQQIDRATASFGDRLGMVEKLSRRIEQSLLDGQQHAEAVLKNTERSQQQFETSLNSAMQNLKTIDDQLAKQSQAAGKSVSLQVSALRELAGMLEGQFEASAQRVAESQALLRRQAESLGQQIKTLESTSTQSGQRLQETQQALAHGQEEFNLNCARSTESLNKIHSGAIKVNQSFSLAARGLHHSIDELQQRIDGQHVSLQQSHAALSALLEAVEGENQRVEQLCEKAGFLLEKLPSALTTPGQKLLSDVTAMRDQTTEVVEEIQHQTAQMNAFAAGAKNAVQQLKHVEIQQKRGEFLRRARFIVQELHSLSFDVNRLLFNEIDEQKWKQFVGGERAVFTRSLLNKRADSLLQRVKERMVDDKETRDHVVSYLRVFEELLSESAKNDPEKLLESTFLTADVGKLYQLLKSATSASASLKSSAHEAEFDRKKLEAALAPRASTKASTRR